MARPRKTSGASSTRAGILRESARLFSELGYEGASTRAISEAVGIKQPSLFHYFPDKEAIGHELVRLRVERSALLSGRFEYTDDDPALDLFLLITDEIAIEFDEQADTRWLFRLPPLVAEKFPEWGAALRAARETTENVVSRGVETGCFVAEYPVVVLDLLDAVANEAMFWPEGGQDYTPAAVATVLLRLVVSDQQEIERIAARAPRAPHPSAPAEPSGAEPSGPEPDSSIGTAPNRR